MQTQQANTGHRPGCLASLGKEKSRMSKEFFKLPESDKRRIWAALLARWAAKKPATH